MKLSEKISCAIRGFNPEKYFGYREKYYKAKTRIAKAYYKLRVVLYERGKAYIGLFPNAENEDIFGGIPNLVHGLCGVFVTAEARIGKNATILQNVTIGKNKGKAPIIGDNVFIGANACIIGDVHVGDNVKIGAGAVVVKDVPDNMTVVSQPCRYLYREVGYEYSVEGE